MKVIACADTEDIRDGYEDIMTNKLLRVFHSDAKLDEDKNLLIITFTGAIRVDNPYRYLSSYIDELARILPQQTIQSTLLDFVKMRFCNDNGFYVLMDICDVVSNLVPGRIMVRRLADDDWQQSEIPVLLHLTDESMAERVIFEDIVV